VCHLRKKFVRIRFLPGRISALYSKDTLQDAMNIPSPGIAVAGLLLHLAIMVLPSQAAPGDVDLSFDAGSGIDGSVSTVAVQPDGKVVIGGSFRTVNGLVRPRIARLNADGSGDASFNPGTETGGSLDASFNVSNDAAAVNAVALQPDGRVLASGTFSALNGSDRVPIFRFHGDGSRDSSFTSALGTHTNSGGLAGNVRSVALQPDGRVIVAGRFHTTNEATLNVVARLNADGSLDGSFVPATAAFLTSAATLLSVAVQADGKVLVGGLFTTFNGIAREGIARLQANGSVDTTFNPDPGTRRSVYSITVQTDGKVLIGGYARVVSTNAIENVVRLDANGIVDGSFNSGATSFSGDVKSIALQPDGKLIVGGGFDGLVRLNANGSRDSNFNPGTKADGTVSSVAVQSDGKVLVGGLFASFNGTVRTSMARLHLNGPLDSSFNPGAGVSASVYALAVRSDSKVLIGGNFSTINGQIRNQVARLNDDGSVDHGFDPGAGFTGGNVLALAEQPDGKVVIAGNFTMINGAPRNYVARLAAKGTLDVTFNPGQGPDNVVFAVALQPDGKVLIGGRFTAVNGTLRGGIARLNLDGSLDAGFGTGTGGTGSVYAIAVQSNGMIIRGGDYIARLTTTGSLDAGFDPGTGVDDTVESVVVQPDGKILIGGHFTIFNGTARSGFARLGAGGALDEDFGQVMIAGGTTDSGTSVNSITMQRDGKILLGGSYSTVNATPRNNLVRLTPHGQVDSSFAAGTGINGALGGPTVYATAVQPDGRVLIGGDFTRVNNNACWRVARLFGDPAALSLNIAHSNGLVILSWPATGVNFRLQESGGLSSSDLWSPVTEAAVTDAGSVVVSVPTNGSRRFFRLVNP
jgi:uncharacterized delta-60 repeat protein